MEKIRAISGKTVLVTGGTGSFGNVITDHLLKQDPKKIIVYSRDENKQYHMRNKYASHSDVLDFQIGDVRDLPRLTEVMQGVDTVFHAAALKHVPQCEYFPSEAVKTNILGAKNVIDAGYAAGVDVVVSVSTDKAVKPVNAMGMTKAIQEKLFIAANHEGGPRFICVRYGNVVGSRGSVIPFFKDVIAEGKPLPITDVRMTRFWLTLDEAIWLVFKAADEGKGGEIFVKKMPACKITELAEVMGAELGGRKGYPTVVTGLRPGEKIHEVLVSEEEMSRAVETAEHFVVQPFGRISAPKLLKDWFEYSSNVTHVLSAAEIRTLLQKVKVLNEDVAPKK